MVFTPAPVLPQLPEIPDFITVAEFMKNEAYGRHSLARSYNPYTCGLTGKTYTATQVIERVDHLARALRSRLGFSPSQGTEWDRVVALYSLNTIDYIPLTHAVHFVSGVVTPASAAYSASELEHQLRTSGAKALFTCVALLDNALKAARAAGISNDRIFILSMANDTTTPFKTIDNLIDEGKRLPALEPLNWSQGQGARQTAFLSYSSGTSGLPKAVKISHYNVIASILQTTTFEAIDRKQLGIDTQISLGILPFSHIYGLALISHVAQYRGDEIVVLPKFDLDFLCKAIEKYKIELLSVVPPMLIHMLGNQGICAKYNLSSVGIVNCAAAPLPMEVLDGIRKVYPKWKIGQAYGMTECTGACIQTSELDNMFGSAGALLPNVNAKLVDSNRKEVTEYEKPGELWIQSPTVALGYLNNDEANAETFVNENGRWLKTGDEVVVKKSPNGIDHFIVVDRIKELIKVKGNQVAPAELEAHLLGHPFVGDCAVIAIPHDWSGEVPKAFIVKSKEVLTSGVSDKEIELALRKHVETHKAKYKWLDRVEFIDVIPKSPSGKILRRLLRDKEKMSQEKEWRGKL